ncbi:MAG: folylpolyglutamate synthase/dihydrofolate synthase family protein [Oscillospiraceae bacterium]
MNSEQALQYIHGIYRRGKKDGLKRITELLDLLGNPQDSLRFIHVAGTNGKGSVCVMLSKILELSGYKTGMYTSPFIMRFNERIIINGIQIPDEKLAEVTEYVSQAAETMKILPSEFELVTAIALEYFKRENCDAVVLETGLGGSFDATNAVKNKLLEIITPIDYDHQRELGSTISEIAAHKCGIIIPYSMVVTCEQRQEAAETIARACLQNHADLSVVASDEAMLCSGDLSGQIFRYKGDLYRLALLGKHQLQNAALVLRAVEKLRETGMNIPHRAVEEGLAAVSWVGRFELLMRDPIVVVDGGHNPQGVRAAVESAREYLSDNRLTVVLGVMADKDFGEMFELVDTVATGYVATNPDYPRALPCTELAKQLKKFGKQVIIADNVSQAVKEAVRCARSDENGAVLCVGTLYMIGEVRKAVKEIQK